jgi:4a-hydroxytetrahydrobiopterin dehydratase
LADEVEITGIVIWLRLKRHQVKVQLPKVKGWKLRGDSISRLYVFEDFVQALRFINRIARLAEGMNHHPDIDIRYNKVKLTLTTHDEGGLTMKDFRFAGKIDRIRSK